MNIHDIYRPLLRHFRKKRMAKFYRALSITPQTKILDVGGNPFIWQIAAEEGLPQIDHITVLNLYEEDTARLPSNVRWVVGDGCKLPFEDGEFDVVFSNSVIEHLGDHDSQVAFAKEISRVGKSYWVQTPNPRFFVEPHYLSPFVHWLPVNVRRKVARHATAWGLLTHPSKQEIDERLKEIRLIAPKEFRSMFPSAEIINERFIGMPKSLVAKFHPVQ
jgi:ubiquinone/menaquinone biosynthesis C-methylase UbiE